MNSIADPQGTESSIVNLPTLEVLPETQPVPKAWAADSAPVEWTWHTASERAQMMAIWQMVQCRHAELSLLASYEWTETWLEHYGDLVPHRFATLQVDHQYVGVILLTQGVEDRDGWFHQKTWHWGTAGEPEADSTFAEYNSLACLPEYYSRFVHELLVRLNDEPNWDAIKLDGFVEAELPLEIRQGDGWVLDRKSARWFDLAAIRGAQGGVIKKLGDSTRKNIRQNIRKLGDVRFEWAESVEQAHHIFQDLVRLHQARWQSVGKPGCYASERFTRFHRALIDRLLPQQKMVLLRVTNHSEVLGCSQLLIDRGRALVYQGGRVTDSEGSPGLITDFLSMQECLERGYDAFDFMAGDSIHKQRLTNQVTTLCWATWQRPRWKFRAMAGMRQLRRTMAEWRRPAAIEGQPATVELED